MQKQIYCPAGSRMACTAEAAPQVVVTRERGKNGKLMKALHQRGITVLELPLVETAPGPDQERLPGQLEDSTFDWVVLTSPEAARVFVDGWQLAGRPQVRKRSTWRYMCLEMVSLGLLHVRGPCLARPAF